MFVWLLMNTLIINPLDKNYLVNGKIQRSHWSRYAPPTVLPNKTSPSAQYFLLSTKYQLLFLYFYSLFAGNIP